jgi:molybdopterin converting factor small subunit
MLTGIESLLKHSQQFVVNNYRYLAEFPDTAAILGWESGVDENHLAERRQFFAVWVARLLGLDMSLEFAEYLFRAGQMHAGHGPRHIHVPPMFVTGAVSHTIAWIAGVLSRERPVAEEIPLAMAGWQKMLSLHLHMMLMGYQTAIDYTSGDLSIPVAFYSKMRALLKTEKTEIHLCDQSPITALLTKFFNYFPQARSLALETEWVSEEVDDSRGNPWTHVNSVFKARDGWRVLLNGKDILYLQPQNRNLCQGDRVEIFPPGR